MGTIGVQYLYHMGAFWAPFMYLEIVSYPGIMSVLSQGPT